MYTSYFAKYKGPKGWAITYALPGWCINGHYEPLAPTEKLVKDYKAGLIDEKQYTEIYLALLAGRGITPQQVLKDIGHDAILLCFEGPGKFCHRHIAADWLRAGGIEVSELV